LLVEALLKRFSGTGVAHGAAARRGTTQQRVSLYTPSIRGENSEQKKKKKNPTLVLSSIRGESPALSFPPTTTQIQKTPPDSREKALIIFLN
jgi:hypothetical protein